VERFTDDLGGWGHTALIDGAASQRVLRRDRH
jgi:hypothetical protein